MTNQAQSFPVVKSVPVDFGLYPVRTVIEAHQGTMKVESELGKGSTFWERLPLRQSETVETEPV